MSLTDKLMTLDKSAFNQTETAEIPSKRLSKKLGEQVSIKARSIPSKRFMEIASIMYDGKGNLDSAKSMDAAALLAAEAVIEPDLKDHELQAYLGVATPKEAAEKLFNAAELTRIAQVVREISGFDDGDEVTEVKNS